MSPQSNLDVGIWEKFTDSVSTFSEGVVGFMGRLFGSSNERIIRSLGFVRPRGTEQHSIVPGSLLAEVNAFEESMRSLSDDELKAKTTEFRDRLKQGQTLDDIMAEAFAACREAAWRSKNMRHFDTQIVGGGVLHRGMIAEMVTGEGKTLVATLPAYLNALDGKGVHIITVNDYLARRDCEWMSPIYQALGITAGFIQSDMDPVARRKAYDCDITYGTNSEYGFDYLRDNMKPARWGDSNYPPEQQQCQRNLNFAIIDEVDNILIDEARTPLIISGQAHGNLARYADANRIAVELTRLEKKAQEKLRAIGHGLNIPGHILTDDTEAEHQEGVQEPAVTQAIRNETAHNDEADEDVDVSKIELPPEEKKEKRLGYYFEVKEKERTCHLTDEGIRKAEQLAGVESFYTAGNMEWPHLIDNSLKAHHLYHRDKQYMVMPSPDDGILAIIIVDEFTGRPMFGRQWSDGLHQAVEAKHARDGVRIKEETQTLATVTLQNFFKLYGKLAGMTGTAMTEANEFWKIYKLEVVTIPTNRPLTRVNYPDVVYMTEKEKWEAVVTEIERIHRCDVVYLNDGTEVVGTIEKEDDAQITVKLKDSRESKSIEVSNIKEIDRNGRPILVGTTNVNQSEKLSKLLNRRGIKHELLNAKPEYVHREAEIVAQAGRLGAVTISTNMAGRGTDIILGGNPEYLAWSRLKDKYATRLDVPPEEWKAIVDEIRVREDMEATGQAVKEMGGLHIIGTERHEARRIDNQLRGRAGRQGDPGSSRFYVSLQDDLMRVFAGEWVAGVLQRLGMEEGQSIESKMVSRRIEAAQKKVEEHHFDIRKNLLEYDEVMDYQRKRVYGFRQEILDGANCKRRIHDMLRQQIDLALARYLTSDYGPASFAELVVQKLNVDVEASDFQRCSFEDADGVARERAQQMIQSMIQEAMDENLDTEVDPSEWNWRAMSDQMNKLWGLKTTDRQLKKIGRDDVAGYLIKEAEAVVREIDLSKGRAYLQSDWGIQSLCTWFDLKFSIKLDPQQFDTDKGPEPIRKVLLDAVHQLSHQKEIEFPVTVAMARYMAEQGGGPAGQRYHREGLMQWYQARFGQLGNVIEEEFRTSSRAKLMERLLDVSKQSFPEATQDDLDAMLHVALEGTKAAELADAQEIANWIQEHLKIEINPDSLVGVSPDQARDIIWNLYDDRYRPEMKRMERSLLLGRLDLAWKNHLLTMDHLRQGIGLVSYAQIDPKTEFKRIGMKEFDTMWDGLSDKVTDVVFRMEDDEAFQESVWAIGAMVHESAPQISAAQGSIQQEQQDAIAGSQKSEKPVDPIRNRGEKVGRNDPCPCGSGRKYKNCCMKKAVK